jgi:hypothetical protein
VIYIKDPSSNFVRIVIPPTTGAMLPLTYDERIMIAQDARIKELEAWCDKAFEVHP